MHQPKSRELTVVFLIVGEEEWLVYLDQLPEIRGEGKTPKAAFSEAMVSLKEFDRLHYGSPGCPANKFSYQVSSLLSTF